MILLSIWLNYLQICIFRRFIETKGSIIHSISRCIAEMIYSFLAVNLVFYFVEKMIFGHGFIHVGDYILMAYLAIKFVVSMVMIYTNNRHFTNKAYFIA